MPIDRPSPGTSTLFFFLETGTLIFSAIFSVSALDSAIGSRSCVEGTNSASLFFASVFLASRDFRFFSLPIAILRDSDDGWVCNHWN